MIGAALDFVAGRVWGGVSPNSDRLAELWGAGPTKSGAVITHDSALTISAVFRAQELVSDAVKSLPCFVYDRVGENGKRINREHDAFRLLHESPNPNTTPSRFHKLLTTWVMSWGNGYAELEIRGGGEIVNVWQIHPSRVTVEKDGPTINYRVLSEDGPEVRIEADRMLHVMGFSKDGYRGISVIGCARESLGLTVRAEEYGAQFFGNNARPSVILEHPGSLKDGGLKLRTQWEKAFGAEGKPHATAVLEDGMKANIIGMPNEDAQFLQTRNFQVVEIARWWGVPPHMLGDMSNAHYNNIEHSEIEFSQFTVLPRAKDFEEEFQRKLLRKEERPRMFIAYNMDGLLRGDSKSRNESYQIQRRNGIISANEWRSREDLNPIEGEEGDVRIVEGNMAPLDSFLPDRFDGGTLVSGNQGRPTPKPTPEPEPDDEDDDDTNGKVRVATAFTPMLVDIVSRMRSVYLTAKARAEKAGKYGPDWTVEYMKDHLEKFHTAIAPAVESMAALIGGIASEEVFNITKTAGPLYWSYCMADSVAVSDSANMLAWNLIGAMMELKK